MKHTFGSIFKRGALLAAWMVAGPLALQAQQSVMVFAAGTHPSTNGAAGFRSGGGFGLSINGSDVGTIVFNTCDLDKNGKVSLLELKETAAGCLKLWDADANGSVSSPELLTALKQLFPTPPPGSLRGVRVINGVVTEVSAEDLPAPDIQIGKRLMAGADSNKDSALTAAEVSAFLAENFKQWDQDGDGSLKAQELTVAFGQLAMPELPNP